MGVKTLVSLAIVVVSMVVGVVVLATWPIPRRRRWASLGLVLGLGMCGIPGVLTAEKVVSGLPVALVMLGGLLVSFVSLVVVMIDVRGSVLAAAITDPSRGGVPGERPAQGPPAGFRWPRR